MIYIYQNSHLISTHEQYIEKLNTIGEAEFNQ